MTALARSSSLARGDQVPNAFDCGNLCFQQLRGSYEPKFGGFSQAPKFPQPVNMNLLLRWHVLNQGKDSDLALDMCVHTLRMIKSSPMNKINGPDRDPRCRWVGCQSDSKQCRTL